MSPCVAEGFVIYILHTRLNVCPGQRYTNSFLHVENQFKPHLALRGFFFYTASESSEKEMASEEPTNS